MTIKSNDDAHGVFEFSDDSIYKVIDEPEGAVKRNNEAVFTITRGKGALGVIQIIWSVVNATMNVDVQPLSDLLTFDPFDRQKSFTIAAVRDDVPELAKNLTVQLRVLSGM